VSLRNLQNALRDSARVRIRVGPVGIMVRVRCRGSIGRSFGGDADQYVRRGPWLTQKQTRASIGHVTKHRWGNESINQSTGLFAWQLKAGLKHAYN